MQQPPQNPYEQPGSFTTPPPVQRRNPWRWYRRRHPVLQVGIGCASLIVLLFVGIFCAAAIAVATGHGVQPTPASQSADISTPTTASQPTTNSQPTATPTTANPTPTPTATKIPTPTPTPSHYPPKTKDDLQALAAAGDANAIHAFHSESVGLTGVCPQPKVEVTVDPSITGQKLIEDLLAYFYGNHYDNPCGAVVFAYHSQAEANGDSGYTAGRVMLDTSDQSGGTNTDPNATGLNYSLTLDAGDVATGKEYTVTYNQ